MNNIEQIKQEIEELKQQEDIIYKKIQDKKEELNSVQLTISRPSLFIIPGKRKWWKKNYMNIIKDIEFVLDIKLKIKFNYHPIFNFKNEYFYIHMKKEDDNKNNISSLSIDQYGIYYYGFWNSSYLDKMTKKQLTKIIQILKNYCDQEEKILGIHLYNSCSNISYLNDLGFKIYYN